MPNLKTFCWRGETRFGEPGVFNLEGHPFSVLKWSATQFTNSHNHQNIGDTQVFSRLVHTLTPPHLGPCTTFGPGTTDRDSTQTGMENAQLGVHQWGVLRTKLWPVVQLFV